jgi:predicted DCC family thiol-disulfide oxidoreductase YuxK
MIVVFDAQCVLCSAWVAFLLKHDRRDIFRFASIQTPAGQAILAGAGLRVDALETLVLVDGDKHYRYTAAILRVLHQLGWPWRAFWVGWLVPAPIRDALYRWAARNRYRIFGRRDACYLPRPEDAHRFIE